MKSCQLMGQLLHRMKTKTPVPRINYWTHNHLHSPIRIFHNASTMYTTCMIDFFFYIFQTQITEIKFCQIVFGFFHIHSKLCGVKTLQ